MSPLRYLVFLGSTREGRMGIRPANYIMKILRSTNHKPKLIDPLQYKLPLVEKPYHFHEDPTKAPQILKDLHEEIVNADGYFVVSPEYNYCIAPALTNLMDHFPISAYWCKPCGIVTYSMGHFGGFSAAMQLRTFLGGLGMMTPQFCLPIPTVHEVFTDESQPPSSPLVVSSVEKIIREVDWLAEALKNQRNKVGLPQS